jgi:hypothetical protein
MLKGSVGAHRLSVIVGFLAMVVFIVGGACAVGGPMFRNWSDTWIVPVFWAVFYGATRGLLVAWRWVQEGFRADKGGR